MKLSPSLLVVSSLVAFSAAAAVPRQEGDDGGQTSQAPAPSPPDQHQDQVCGIDLPAVTVSELQHYKDATGRIEVRLDDPDYQGWLQTNSDVWKKANQACEDVKNGVSAAINGSTSASGSASAASATGSAFAASASASASFSGNATSVASSSASGPSFSAKPGVNATSALKPSSAQNANASASASGKPSGAIPRAHLQGGSIFVACVVVAGVVLGL